MSLIQNLEGIDRTIVMALLEVKKLNISLDTIDGKVDVIRDIDLKIQQGDKLGIVGESGCGKTITALALMSLLPPNAIVSGEILLQGQNLLTLSERQWCDIRGNRISMIFQEPMSALNPVKSIGAQISESILLHRKISRREIQERVIDLMENVGLPTSRFPLNLYPHQLSGGQRQRVMIAMAIACKPDILIADEPTTALDVTVQEQILDLIEDLADQSGMAVMMISHDLGIIAQTTEKVMVMYTGSVMEQGNTVDVFRRMTHPYTLGLFSAIPRPGSSQEMGRKRLNSIPGQVPDLQNRLTGCNFRDRCSFASDLCRTVPPGKTELNEKHQVWCYHPVMATGDKG